MDAPLNKLEQQDLKSILVSYLRTQSDFTDFDYEGSNLSILLDVLAFNTKITNYNINLVANELALETSTFRDNVVAAAKRLGYNPKSYTASKVNVTIDINLENDYETVEISKGAVLSAKNNNTVYLFNTDKLIETPINSAVSFTFDALEGRYLRNRFIVEEFSRFIIPNNFVDTDTISVSVVEDGNLIKYAKRTTIDNLTSNDRVYFVEEIQDQKYEVIFGDGVLGRKLQNGETVIIDYLVTSGQDANNIKSFSSVVSIVGTYPNGLRETITTGIAVTINSPQSFNGSNFETINSIKFNAPRFYSAQDRAVTLGDYESIIKRNFPNIRNIKVVSGDELSEPKFGKIFIYTSLENSNLDNFTKERIRKLLDDYRIPGFKLEFLDPEFTEVLLYTKILYDPTKTNKTVQELRDIVNNTIKSYKNLETVKSFGGRFINSQLSTLITNADSSFSSVQTEPVMKKNICFNVNVNGYTIDFKNAIGTCLNRGLVYSDQGIFVKGYANKVFLSDDGKGNMIISGYRNNVLKQLAIVGTIDYSRGIINISLEPTENICIDLYVLPNNENISAVEESVLTINPGTIDIVDINDPNNSSDPTINLPEIESPVTANQDLDETNLTLDDFSPIPSSPDRCF